MIVFFIMLYRMIPGKFRHTCPREGASCSERALEMAKRGAAISLIFGLLCLDCSAGSHTPRTPLPDEPNPTSDGQPVQIG